MYPADLLTHQVCNDNKEINLIGNYQTVLPKVLNQSYAVLHPESGLDKQPEL